VNGERGGPTVATNGGSHGAVAGTIHGGVHNNYYQVPPGASPWEKFDIALRYLASGQATTARKLLAEVTVEIRSSTKVWFHWLLAFFSERTLWELSAEDRAALKAALDQIDELPREWWTPGIDAIRHLVAASRSRNADQAAISQVRREIEDLDATMRKEVLRHLERVLQGSLKDELWHEDVRQAEAGRRAERRRERVWKFFEPDPAQPRTRPVRPVDVSGGDLAAASVLATAVSGAVAMIGWLALQRDDTSAIIALTVALIAAGVAVTNGAEWRFRVERLRAENRQLRAQRLPSDAARPGGFTYQVDRLYMRYADKYAPKGHDRAAWLVDAYGPMSRLRDELVEVYREKRVRAEAVKWLIRFQARELRREWDAGALVEQHRRWTVPAAVKAFTITATLVTVTGLMWGIQSAARQNLLQTAGALVAITAAGWTVVVIGLRILAENKRVVVDEFERDQRETTYWFEYQRWQRRLSDRPQDMEMAQWLDCDRRILLQHALAAYQLKWSDISAYASMEARGDGSRRARAKNGPWRYSRYKLLVFLLTADGVRQISVELDFAQATFHHWERTNYRYDAVAAVRVTALDDGAREFQLFLVNGADIEVAVTEPGQAGADEDSRILADGAQDATGLRNTLFVLEGVAAEGRSWWAGPAYRRAS
jgi:hypothetical protein